MATWQERTLDDLRRRLGPEAVRPYGSVVDGDTDRWSDLDVRLVLDDPTSAAALFDGVPWAWQDGRDGADQVLRLVLTDGRRVDARVSGAHVTLPTEPDDLTIRFDAALAVTRIGRGNDLIGLHLVLGVLRETLVLGMLLADRDTDSEHHRRGTEHDELAGRVTELLRRPVDVTLPVAAYELHGAELRRLRPEHCPDPTGLHALLTGRTAAERTAADGTTADRTAAGRPRAGSPPA